MRARNRLVGVLVLVVEDDHDLLEFLRRRLSAEGATVVDARTGREALTRAAERPLDIALTDLGLPDMPGEAVVAGLRSTWGERAVIVVVSGAQPEDLARALRNGADCVFRKPIDWTDLVRSLAYRNITAAIPGLSGVQGPSGCAT